MPHLSESVIAVDDDADVPQRARTGKGIVLFSEVGRDTELPSGWTDPPVSRGYTVAHEVGHLFGCIHADGQLMTPTAQRTLGTFDPVCINEIRSGLHP